MDKKIETADEILKNIWEINSNTTQYNLKTILNEIELGNKEQGGINLKPYYQREYKFTRKDESLLIESLLGGIPIPIIYLASDTRKIPHISNVIDGQHRLMAVYRFLKNKFKLTGLKKYTILNDKSFSELDSAIQNKLLYQISLTLQFIHVQNDPELELEIFTRYNQGTNPLTPQEIRNVVYDSKFNTWLGNYIDNVLKKDVDKGQTIFNIIKNRYGNKSIHQELYVFFGIFKNIISKGYSKKEKNNIESGINRDYYSSTDYVSEFMAYARECTELESSLLIKECKEYLEIFIDALDKIYIKNGIKYPLSKEIYEKTVRRNQKAQTSILMILTPIIYWIKYEYKINLNDSKNTSSLMKAIKEGFRNSRFPITTSSTTEPSLVIDTINCIKEKIKENF